MKNVGYYESSSDEWAKEKVLTEKEKRYRDMEQQIEKLNDKIKI